MGGGGGGGDAGFDESVLIDKEEAGFRGLWNNKRAFSLAMFASLGGVLYGYNQGVFSSVQVMNNFLRTYPEMNESTTKGMVTAILELGAMVGSLMGGPTADVFSRKYSIAGFCVLFMVGVVIQTAANSHLACMWAGRWFAGMGIGALSMLVPMYNAELASAGVRGSLVALQQLAITLGILISYWIGYGTNYIGGTGDSQTQVAWRLPLGLQLAPAVILVVGCFFLPFSPRWLMLQGREEECLMTLAKVRNKAPEDPQVQYEFRALQAERLVEKEAAKDRYGIDTVNMRVSLLEYRRLITTKSLLHRLMLGASAQALQQWTGINAVIYYAPTIFEQIGLEGPTIGLLATGLVGIVNFLMTIPAVLFVDNFGRRPLLMWGEVNMAISHAVLAAVVAVYTGRFGDHKSAGNGAVFMVYWYIANFAVTWGPLAWVVSAEVFPLDMRAKGMSFSSATNWLMNFTVALVTPVMFDNIQWRTYIVFMVFCIIGFLYALLVLPELKGLSLEEIDTIFHDRSGAEDRERRERIAKEIGLDKIAAEVNHDERRLSAAGARRFSTGNKA